LRQEALLALNFHRLLSPLCIFNNIAKARMVAQEAVSKGQSMGAWRWSLLYTFGKTRDPNFNHPTILQAPQGL